MGHSGKGHQHDFAERFSDPEAIAQYARHSARLPLRNRGLWSALRRLNPVGVWLDLGCGPGLTTIEIASRFPGLRLIGIDVSEHMIGYAREQASSAGLADRVQFAVGDVTDASVLSAHAPADGIVSTYTLHHFDDAVAAIRTMASALAPGAPLLLCDFRRVMWLSRWLPTADAYRPPEAAALMTQAGMTSVEVASHFPYAMTILGRKAP
jgi:ubiquinone/menaquinone biosynthesis C-methylase UbiE